MDFHISIIVRPLISKLIALQSFFCARPRIDIDLINNQYGRKSLCVSHRQDCIEPISTHDVIYDFEFYWKYRIKIKNNSSKTAFNLKIERVFEGGQDYLQKIDDLVSLKQGERIELDYILRHIVSKKGIQTQQYHFPEHIPQIEILISYTNESRKKFYTRFIATKDSKTNEHLLKCPKQ